MKPEYNFDRSKRGAIIPQEGKTRITIYIDNDILEAFRQKGDAEGKGYQTMMNQALRQYLDQAKLPLDEDTLRRIFQEELRAVTFVNSV
ncbi:MULTISPECIES: BrnA antitoxin family protein [Planktothricoides]|nr:MULTISPECIES: BrnA antitoxin family protein [Planktothricoides]KOR37212.1 CopG family transcriptional regulator [Planktothricoides sp. SR001]MBD2545707.1 BrnA antitoxin family protein [Planktothricoides raciborskii FACHB-1370]MBD2582721.1 BrnA antitoxin family protein [Planktothricoides raciborskii FACHB-1261]